MSPLEWRVHAMTVAFQMRRKVELEEWEKKVNAEIHAMAVARREGLGQLFRHAARRLAAAHQGGR